MSDSALYRIAPTEEWEAARTRGVYAGSAHDLADGFLHLSSGRQVAGTLQRFYAGRVDLVLLTIAPERLSGAVRWEASSEGELFPHLYSDLPAGAVVRADALGLDEAGRHKLPPHVR